MLRMSHTRTVRCRRPNTGGVCFKGDTWRDDREFVPDESGIVDAE